MIFHWLNASEAETTASELADHFAARPANGPSGRPEPVKEATAALQDLLRRADTDPRLAGLNFFKKARFANSFKWRLLENGVERRTADRVTHSLLVHLSRRPSPRDEMPAPGEDVAPTPLGERQGISCGAATKHSPVGNTMRHSGSIDDWLPVTPPIPRS